MMHGCNTSEYQPGYACGWQNIGIHLNGLKPNSHEKHILFFATAATRTSGTQLVHWTPWFRTFPTRRIGRP
eukprot:6224368-Pyramimonas_sp.AAC.1